jgi:hypothetical protein
MGKFTASFAVLMLLSLSACDVFPEHVSVQDPRLAPLWQAARGFDRAKYGFTPLPQFGYVGWERRSRAGYDSMLHLEGKTGRTIAFRKTGTGYRWIGEQESFPGPKTYKTPDGDQREEIVLNYDIEPLDGSPLNKLSIDYFGEDPLLDGQSLTLDDVRPILKQWGY